MIDYFRTLRGIVLDEAITFLPGAGRPGLSVDTNDALVGSIYTDNVAGSLYIKKTNGSGTARWAEITGSGGGGGSTLSLYSESAGGQTPPAALGTNSIALS